MRKKESKRKKKYTHKALSTFESSRIEKRVHHEEEKKKKKRKKERKRKERSIEGKRKIIKLE